MWANMWFTNVDKIKIVENRKEFFTQYYDRCPALCQINIDLCDEKLKEYKI
jgi:hypothetical protein